MPRRKIGLADAIVMNGTVQTVADFLTENSGIKPAALQGLVTALKNGWATIEWRDAPKRRSSSTRGER